MRGRYKDRGREEFERKKVKQGGELGRKRESYSTREEKTGRNREEQRGTQRNKEVEYQERIRERRKEPDRAIESNRK